MNLQSWLRPFVVLVLLLLSAFLRPTPAGAQAITFLGGVEISTNGGSGVAYDDKHHVYGQTYELNNDIYFRFLDASLNQLGTPFPIGHKALFAGQPVMTYSSNDPNVDEFLVLYITDAPAAGQTHVNAQRVAYTGSGPNGGGLVGSFILPTPDATNAGTTQKPNDLTYNPLQHEFLVAFENHVGTAIHAEVSRIAADGSVPAGPVDLSAGQPYQQGGGTVAFDWQRDRYLAAFFGQGNGGLEGTFGFLLDGTTAQPITPLFTAATGFTNELGSVYLPEADGFLVTFTLVTNKYTSMGQIVPSTYSSGALPSGNFGVIARPTSNAGFASADYDSVSREVLVAAMCDPVSICGNILDAHGSPQGAGFTMNTLSTQPAFYPTTVAAENGIFGVDYDINLSITALERYKLPAAPTPGPKCCSVGPPPPPAGVIVQVDEPTENQTLTPPFIVAGWAIDTNATTGPGVDFVHVWAYPHSGGSPFFVGAVGTGGARPDVANAYGANFLNSGYGVPMANVPPGSYTLVFFPHSSFTGNFDYNKVKTLDVTILASALTQIDSPTWGQVWSAQGVGMDNHGWAIDLTNANGTGIDLVNVYAYAASTGTPTFLGTATYGIWRQDVVNSFNDFRFLPSGYSLTNAVPLSPDLYFVAVFSHSIGAATFNPARVVGAFTQ